MLAFYLCFPLREKDICAFNYAVQCNALDIVSG